MTTPETQPSPETRGRSQWFVDLGQRALDVIGNRGTCWDKPPSEATRRYTVDCYSSDYVPVDKDAATEKDVYARVVVARVSRGEFEDWRWHTGAGGLLYPTGPYYSTFKQTGQVHRLWVEHSRMDGDDMERMNAFTCGLPPIEEYDYDRLGGLRAPSQDIDGHLAVLDMVLKQVEGAIARR